MLYSHCSYHRLNCVSADRLDQEVKKILTFYKEQNEVQMEVQQLQEEPFDRQIYSEELFHAC